MNNKQKTIILVSLIPAFLVSCVDQEKGKLDNRVLEYWTAKINKNYEKAYEYLSPGWQKNESKQSFASRMGTSKANWLSASIDEKICSKSYLCEVKIKIKYEYEFQGAMSDTIEIESVVSENWIMKDNVWYNVPKK